MRWQKANLWLLKVSAIIEPKHEIDSALNNIMSFTGRSHYVNTEEDAAQT